MATRGSSDQIVVAGVLTWKGAPSASPERRRARMVAGAVAVLASTQVTTPRPWLS